MNEEPQKPKSTYVIINQPGCVQVADNNQQVLRDFMQIPQINGDTQIICSVIDLVFTMQRLETLLRRMDIHCAGKQLHQFFDALQEFLHGTNLLTTLCDKNLLYASDLLARALFSITLDPSAGIGYRQEKIGGAAKLLLDYLKSDPSLCQVEGPESEWYLAISNLIRFKKLANTTTPDRLLLDLITSLVNFGKQRRLPDKLTQEIFQSTFEFLNYLTYARFNLCLPPIQRDDDWRELRCYCRETND